MRFVLVNYNVFAPVMAPLRFTSQKERMARIPAALIAQFPDADAVVIQESMVPAQHEILRKGLSAVFPYETEPITGSLAEGQLVRGGIVIFSRYPIMEQSQHPFGDDCCVGNDCMSAKGFTYAKIDKFGVPFHVVGTHFQAWASEESRVIRQQQAFSIGSWLRDRTFDGPVLVCGDLNVDRYSEQAHMQTLLDAMRCDYDTVPLDSYPFTVDPETNVLVGNDEDAAYSCDEYPGGCYEEYLESGRCPCATQEWLDYTLYYLGVPSQFRPTHSEMRAVALKTAPFDGHINMKTVWRHGDLSDHYPVVGTFEYDTLEPLRLPPVAQDTTVQQSPAAILIGGLLFVAILAAIVFLVHHCASGQCHD